MSQFRFVMIGAMYENGGNTTQRFLDGHPELCVYPFESQVGTKYVNDSFSSMFPLKYRWPMFPSEQTPEENYEAIIDEECKVRIRTPFVSKFRDEPFDLSDKSRKEIFVGYLKSRPRDNAAVMEAFFKSTFEAWRDFKSSGKNSVYVGYSPIITVDADRILKQVPDSHFIHVVRNPYSAYSDTKKRAVPLSLANYITAWTINQQFALYYKELYPSRFHIIRFEDLVVDSKKAFKGFCDGVGISNNEDSLLKATWNSKTMAQVYPWGTIRTPTPEANLATANELNKDEKSEIKNRTNLFLKPLGYENFLA